MKTTGMKRLILALLAGILCPCYALCDTKIEAESAAYVNCKLITDSKYSGGKALELTESNAKITFTHHAAERGKCDVYVGYDGLYGGKKVNLAVNGNSVTFDVNGRAESMVGTFFMNAGNNSIVITPNWTWFRIDYIRIATSSSIIQFDIAKNPVDANATDAAKTMYRFLYDNFGKKVISGIMTGDMGSANGNVTQHLDVQAVYKASGKYPALIGFDFMNATGKSASLNYNKSYTTSSIALAKDTYRRGGLPNFTWHWRDPSRSTDAFYTADCTMKISNAMNADGSWNTSSQLYKYLIQDIHTIADYFLSLQKEGMAVTFRPLHEASGGWFWWGREGAKPFIKLFRLIYEEMVNVKGVHNVIWIWNAGENDADWDPGEAYYDVVSADIYNNDFDYSSNYASFDKLKSLTKGKKIVALSENGPIPDIDKMVDEEAVWSWWMPWYQTWNGRFVDKTSKEEWKKCMNDDRVITLEDLAAGWAAYSGIQSAEATVGEGKAIYDLQGRRLTGVPARGLYISDSRIYSAGVK